MTDRTDHRWAIDGIESGMARVEEDGKRFINVPVYLLPAGAKEGVILRVTRTAKGKQSVDLTIAIDEEATAQAIERSRATTQRAMNESRKRDPGGDVSL